MDIVEVTGARRFSRERASRFGLIDRPRLVCDLVCLEPGQRESRREQPASDEMYYVIEGKGVLRIGIHEYEVAAGQALVVPPQLEHWLSNPGPARLTALAFVAPKPGREAEVRRPGGGPGRVARPRAGEEEGERRPFRAGPRDVGYRERAPRPPGRARPPAGAGGRTGRTEGPRTTGRPEAPRAARGGPPRGRAPAAGRREGPAGRGGPPRGGGGPPRRGGGAGGAGRGRPPGRGPAGGPRRPGPRRPRPSS